MKEDIDFMYEEMALNFQAFLVLAREFDIPTKDFDKYFEIAKKERAELKKNGKSKRH